MGDWSRYRPIVFILVALVALAMFVPLRFH
jgi:hypothetical protein